MDESPNKSAEKNWRREGWRYVTSPVMRMGTEGGQRATGSDRTLSLALIYPLECCGPVVFRPSVALRLMPLGPTSLSYLRNQRNPFGLWKRA